MAGKNRLTMGDPGGGEREGDAGRLEGRESETNRGCNSVLFDLSIINLLSSSHQSAMLS